MSTIKYQIFISSTYTDLKDERDEVIKAILEMGHIPVGMEMFSAADEEQWKLISRQIDQSDYYIVIVAHRYGSVVGKKSYTEKEYDYAVQKGVPVIGFIIDDSAPWPKDKIESDSNKAESLNRFKQKVKRKLVGFWSVKDELCGKVSRSLIKLITTNPRPGWIRTSETVGPEVVSEMSRLSSENARLNSENIQLKKELEQSLKIDNSHFSQGEELIDIEFSFFIDKSKYENNKINISWNNLFLEIGKELLENTIEYRVREAICQAIFEKKDSFGLSVMINSATYLQIRDQDFFKIKTQFVALGYIITAPKNASIADRHSSIADRHFGFFNNTGFQTHWILTQIGKKKLADLLAIRRCK